MIIDKLPPIRVLEQHIQLWGGIHHDYCVGITNYAPRQLVEHNVEHVDSAIYIETEDVEAARMIEIYF